MNSWTNSWTARSTLATVCKAPHWRLDGALGFAALERRLNGS
ncbi:hypothetical protein CEV34_3631 [Brucella pseudogrignonensis]|uniref:Uncharacterized protein n=1 Tax=Brucella pseudogrignonensis TaxID=419475 RepID=A0A256G919_9HYPH|nr:hypothetical protein CEV34_3631 [Brucella pseudogrignonensis]